METFVVLFVIAALVFGAGAVMGAELQDRIMEARSRRLAARQREVNEAIRWIRTSTPETHPSTCWGSIIGLPLRDPDAFSAPAGTAAAGRWRTAE